MGQNARRTMYLMMMALCGLAWLGMAQPAAAANDWQQPQMSDYVKVPPFVSYSVKPNIMIILDNSGSMNEPAYGLDVAYAGEPYSGIEDEPNLRSPKLTDPWDDQVVVGEVGSAEIPLDEPLQTLALGDPVVGLRFRDVDIPQGAVITKASIQFVAHEGGAGSFQFTIRGEDTDNAEPFPFAEPTAVAERFDPANATAGVAWNSNETWSEGEEYDTTDLKAIVQAIVSRQGWQPGNALAIAIIPSAGNAGSRMAKALYSNVDPDEEEPDPDLEIIIQTSPVLHIQFESPKKGIRYYGYFNPDYFYTYDSNLFNPRYQKINYNYAAGHWNVIDVNNPSLGIQSLTDSQIAPATPANGLWDGNFANWLSMRRIDVMRKVLMGGKRISSTGAGARHVQGENPQQGANSAAFGPKVFSSTDGPATSPYKGANFDYHITRQATIEVSYQVWNSSTRRWNTVTDDYTIRVQKDILLEPQDFHDGRVAGVLQRIGDRARWGNMWFNTGTGKNASGGAVKNVISSSFTENFTNDLQDKQCNTWTPLAETFFVAMKYFAQEWDSSYESNLDYFNNLFAVKPYTADDPYWDTEKQEIIPCAKSFVLMLTDGASKKDSKIPAEYKGYARGNNIPDNSEDHKPKNLREYSIFSPETRSNLDPDPTCNENDYPTNCIYPDGGSDYLADLALYARTNDLRPDIECWENNIVLYTILALMPEDDDDYENATELLKKASLLGGYGDANEDGNPDTYYEASDGYLLERQLMRAINDILSRTSSGTAASVVSSSRSGEGAVYQSVFYPALNDDFGNTVDWSGQVNALLVDAYGNLREDTPNPDDPDAKGKLDIANDLFLVFGTKPLGADDTEDDNLSSDNTEDDGCPPKGGERARVYKYRDVNANGRLDEADIAAGPVVNERTGQPEFELHEINYLWTSTEWLNSDSLITGFQRDYGANSHRRHIFTFVDPDGTMVNTNNEKIRSFTALSDPSWETVTDPNHFFAYMHLYEPFNPPVPPTHSGFKAMAARQAKRIVNFMRGEDQLPEAVGSIELPAFRNRQVDHNGDGQVQTFRLADIVHSSPTAVSRPAENFDLIYRDRSYTDFYRKYRYRRTVLYTGSNGGMLHAFNGGFYDENEKQFVTRPVDAFGQTIKKPDGSHYNEMPLGSELWAYVPFNLLPHLYWLTRNDYEHIYYMDLEPRVFDARIFANDADHPNGWGTVLVAGMRFGGGKIGTNLNKAADIQAYDPEVDRAMSSAYAVFDITNPEKPPRLLAELSFPDLGFTTCHPGVIPMRGIDEDNKETVNQWYLIFGSGPASKDAFGIDGANTEALVEGTSTQQAVVYAVDLVALAQGELVTVTSDGLANYSTEPDAGPFHMVRLSEPNSSVSKPIVVDWDLNYKADTVYFGTSAGDHINGWSGRMRRIVLDDGSNDPTDPSQWITDNTMLSLMSTNNQSANQPISAPATATIDRQGNRWVFFGTGRFESQADKRNTQQQSYYGVKEPYQTGDLGTKLFQYTAVPYSNLMDVSDIGVYEYGYYLSGYDGTFDDLANDIEDNHQGWRMDFPDIGERNLGQAVLAGQALTFTTYTPSDDICSSEGMSQIYALYYRTGTAYKQSIIGLSDLDRLSDGTPLVLKRRTLGPGLTITPNVHVGRQKGTKAFIQTESGSILDLEQQTPGAVKSGKLMWRPDAACPAETEPEAEPQE